MLKKGFLILKFNYEDTGMYKIHWAGLGTTVMAVGTPDPAPRRWGDGAHASGMRWTPCQSPERLGLKVWDPELCGTQAG